MQGGGRGSKKPESLYVLNGCPLTKNTDNGGGNVLNKKNLKTYNGQPPYPYLDFPIQCPFTNSAHWPLPLQYTTVQTGIAMGLGTMYWFGEGVSKILSKEERLCGIDTGDHNFPFRS